MPHDTIVQQRGGNMKGEVKKARRGIKNDDVKAGGDSNGGSGSGGN